MSRNVITRLATRIVFGPWLRIQASPFWYQVLIGAGARPGTPTTTPTEGTSES